MEAKEILTDFVIRVIHDDSAAALHSLILWAILVWVGIETSWLASRFEKRFTPLSPFPCSVLPPTIASDHLHNNLTNSLMNGNSLTTLPAGIFDNLTLVTWM